MSLICVTATTDPARAYPCLKTWEAPAFVGVVNGEAGRTWQPEAKPEAEIGRLTRTWILVPEYFGTVPAFRMGVDFALQETEAEIIACLHDDVQILDPDWINDVEDFFESHPACGLLGFGGATSLGSDSLYKLPYDPMQLARGGFRSNLVDAEKHGSRSLVPGRVVCLDGFSQIGRREFWDGIQPARPLTLDPPMPTTVPPLTYLESLGMKHHFYDGALGCLAARYGWEVWYLPTRCKHLGGMTAVGDRDYQSWAKSIQEGGDYGFWLQSHALGYSAFTDVLPLRLPH